MSITKQTPRNELTKALMKGLTQVRNWLTLPQKNKEPDRKPYGRFFMRAGRVARDTQTKPQTGEITTKSEPPAEIRLVVGGQKGWARQRQERVKAKLGAETYQSIEGLMRWCWGEKIEEVIAEMSVERSGFYYRLEQMLERLPEACADRREENGRLVQKVNEPTGAIVVEQPVVEGQAINPKITDQAGCQSSEMETTGHTTGETFSRYSAHLLQVPALEQLGFYQVASQLDVTSEQTYYSHLLRCHTVLMTLSSGKTRLYHTQELIEDEFGQMLGEERYPGSSDLHAYFDQIVRQDQHQAEQGLLPEQCLVEQFVHQAQQAMARAAEADAGQAIYVDPHVIALHTTKAVAQTKHGVQKRVVKALVKLSAVSANQPGRQLAFQLGQGDLSFHANLEKIVELTSWITGQSVKLVGIDRGGLSQAVLERFEELNIGLMVWSKNNPTMRQQLAAVPKNAFDEGEYDPKRPAPNRLKNWVADVSAMVINQQGYQCRTIVIEDAHDGHRIGIHAVGQPSRELSAHQILAFMRGKQWVEENFKQGIAWGSDAFCGGKIVPTLRRERPLPAEVEKLKVQARQLKKRWRTSLTEEATVGAEWRAGQSPKRHLNDLLQGIRRRRHKIEANWQVKEDLIKWGVTGQIPSHQQQWRVDTRKMLLMSQFQDFARLARQETMALVRRFLKQAIAERDLAARESCVTLATRQAIEQAAAEALTRMPWGQLEKRLFEQGGWVHKDRQQKVMSVTLKPFKQPLLQRACELLCAHLNQQQPLMRCQDGQYSLHYACRASPGP